MRQQKSLLRFVSKVLITALCFSVLCFYTSCFKTGKKKYQYIELREEKKGSAAVRVDKKPTLIYAATDSIAYIQAYLGFCFAQRDYNNVIPGTQLGRLVSFKLLNEASLDIENAVLINNKASIEAMLRQKVASMEWHKK